MPFNAVPVEDFFNRENELQYLKGLSDLKKKALGGDVLLEGERGMGKTELLKQLYRLLYWEDEVVPFYYCFKTANLKGAYFAKDYFAGFVRQYVSFAKKEPSIAQSAAEPLERLMPAISSLGLYWLIDCIEDFQTHVNRNDLYWQIVAAISVPVVAAKKGGKPVTVMLDDFDAAASLYEANLGDRAGLVSLFRESMQNSRCPHVMTGSAGELDAIFTDHSLVGTTEPMRLGPLPEDVAAELFGAHLAHLKIAPPRGRRKEIPRPVEREPPVYPEPRESGVENAQEGTSREGPDRVLQLRSLRRGDGILLVFGIEPLCADPGAAKGHAENTHAPG